MMMSTDRLLLDTTVQIRRIAYGTEEARRFNEELADKADVYTTSLVFREFQRTIIADIEFLYTQTKEGLRADSDGRLALSQLSQFLGTTERYSSRSVQRLHLIVAVILESFTHTKVPKKRILDRLERVANRWIIDFFSYSDKAGKECDIVCLTALDAPGDLKRLRQAGPFLPAPSFPARAASFLEERRGQVELVEAEMRKATQAQGRDDKLLKFLGRLKGKDGEFDFLGRLPRYKNWCWRLGDLLIALEIPEGVVVYSTDRAFTIIASAVGRRLYRGYRSPSFKVDDPGQ
jgi:hypothetical protein